MKRYVIAETIFPSALALAGLTALVLTKDLLGFADLVINRGFGVLTILRITVYQLVPLIAYTLPFALLLGVLAGLSRLRADHEIVSLEAAGISGRRLLAPVLTFATVLMLSGLVFTLWLAPWATRSLRASLQQMVLENPGIALRAGSVQAFGDTRMIAREVSANGQQLRGVLLWIPRLGQTVFAERGALEPVDAQTARLTLYDAETLLSPGDSDGGGDMRFGTFWTILREDAAGVEKITGEDLSGKPVEELLAAAWAAREDVQQIRQAQSELHYRFAYPVSCLVFAVLAVSLSLLSHGSSRAAGVVTGIIVTVVYYGLVQLGDGLVQAGVVDVELGAWLPNFTVSGFAAVLLWLLPWRRGGMWRREKQRGAESAAPSSIMGGARMPRYILYRYIMRSYLQMLWLAFAFLLVGYLLVDVLERLQWFARYQAWGLEVARFYSARIPLLTSRVIPMSLLLATALTVSVLSVRRELIALRACGVSAARALMPILLIAGIVAPLYFLLNEAVVPRTNALAYHIKVTQIKDRGSESSFLQMMVWYRAGTHVYQATQLNPHLGLAQDLSIYELGENGLPVSRTDARAARHLGNGLWELTDPVRIEISAHGLRQTPAETLVRIGEIPEGEVDTMHLNVRQLMRQIKETAAYAYDTTVYRVDLHVKLAAPFACVLLPAVTLFFAIGGPPFPGPAVTLLVSAVLGVGYVLLTGVCASLGYGSFLPPPLAGWSPPLGLALLAGTLALRSRE